MMWPWLLVGFLVGALLVIAVIAICAKLERSIRVMEEDAKTRGHAMGYAAGYKEGKKEGRGLTNDQSR